jgi:hypothetical protein
MTSDPNPAPLGDDEELPPEPDLEEEAHPAEPHPDEPRAESPTAGAAGAPPPEGELSAIGEPHPDEPRLERSQSEPEPGREGPEPAAGSPERGAETSDAPELEDEA